jgi:hypothetical protein
MLRPSSDFPSSSTLSRSVTGVFVLEGVLDWAVNPVIAQYSSSV